MFYYTVDDKGLRFDEMYNSFEILKDIYRIVDDEEDERRNYYIKGDDLDIKDSYNIAYRWCLWEKIFRIYSKV
jgi:uncharacterized protein YjbK